MQVQPYMFFEGRCEEALDFYRDRLGAQILMMMRYHESPEPPAPGMIPQGSEHKIMHAAFKIGDAMMMASDGMCSGQPEFKGVTLSITTQSEDEARKHYDALCDGGQQIMPMQKTFYSPAFGMVRDRFGVSWMVLQWMDPQPSP